MSRKQSAVLAYLAARPVAGAASIMELVRRVDRVTRGHAAGYARVHRLERRGLVTIAPGRVLITGKGLAAAGAL